METIYNKKYEQGLDITEIAKRLRKEIKAGVKTGALPGCKYSVRTARFSMGRSLSVMISDTPFPVNNRRYLELEHALTHKRKGKLTHDEQFAEFEEIGRWTQEAIALAQTIAVMADQWNFDGSDSQSDYFHVNYYSSVDFDSHCEWEAMRADVKQSYNQEQSV
jgi:hypothetical protein